MLPLSDGLSQWLPSLPPWRNAMRPRAVLRVLETADFHLLLCSTHSAIEQNAMSVEIEFPVEVIVPHVPRSLQASAASRQEWKELIREATRKELPEGHFARQDPIKVTIYYFADAPADFDIDNIVKSIFDSLNRFIYIDDKQVERLLVQKFEPGRLFRFTSPSPKLAEAAGAKSPRVYIEIDESIAGEI
jgi:crossover junction endodeoxyribonuclease RusA